MIEFRKRVDGFWHLWWDIERYPNFKFVTSRVLGFCKKTAYSEVDIFVDEYSFLFKVPYSTGGGLYEVAFPNRPETVDALKKIIAYAESVQEELPLEERLKDVRLMRREKYIK